MVEMTYSGVPGNFFKCWAAKNLLTASPSDSSAIQEFIVVMTNRVGTGGGYKVTLMTAFPFYEDDILIYRENWTESLKYLQL